MNRGIALSGAILIALGIIFGAFGAHALKDLITEARLVSFETGVRYQIYQGIALLIIGFNADKFDGRLRLVHLFLLSGVILFSGSIYLLALQDIFSLSLSFLGPITPLGGALLIVGWILFILRLLPENSRQQR